MRTGTVAGIAFGLVGLLLCNPAGARMTAEQRIDQLERQLKAAQEEIQELRQEVKGQQKAQQQTEQKVQEATQQAEKATQTASTVDALAKRVPGWLERISLFGDARIRHDGFYHQDVPEGTSQGARNRERFRARVGLKYTFSDELQAVVRLATGNPDDPISTNETFTGAFNRKHINLDWAYLTIAPGKTFGWRPGVFAMTAGKFPAPFFKPTEMVWDDDLAFEGFSERAQVLGKPCGPFDQINVYGEQWSTQEVSNHEDGWVFGGQINPQGHFGAATWDLGIGHFWYLNPGLIAQQLNTNKALVNTNIVEVDSSGKIVDYASGFSETQFAAQVLVPDVALGMPVIPYWEFVYNWQAATDQSWGSTGGVRFGKPSKRGDWALMAQYEYLERESVLSSFAWSDYGPAGTNVQGPTIGADYMLFDPLTLSVRSSFVNYIDRPANTPNKTMVRLLVDAQIKF